MRIALFFSTFLLFLFSQFGLAQTTDAAQPDSVQQDKPDENQKKWYDKINVRGYTQVRYNRLLETNPDLRCQQCDISWGRGGGIFLRRARIVFSGNVHDRVFFYFQPDFAGGWNNEGQIRDAYMDLALDKDREFRIRLGQSKIPFGFENMQSSSNRLPLDRNDGINSGLKNERDLAAIFYWAPKHIRQRFSWLNKQGLKGSGDYGVVGLGVFNGQTANQPEKNDEPHVVARFTWPFQFNNGQILEASVQGYGGEYVVNSDLVEDKRFDEMRFAGTLVYYPQPFGFQVEYNFGHGPEFVPEKMTVETRDLHGGYVQSMYYLRIRDQLFIPFARWHIYEGGKKHQLDATSHRVNEQEIGVEWQPNRSFELVVMYTMSDRTFENSLMPDNREQGNLLRIQAQVNY